jgi:predicted CXXCH cytochrome family protein
MSARWRDAEHLFRVAGLFLAGLACFVALKVLFVPAGFGAYGHFRAGALDDNRSHPLVYAGGAACGDCHSDTAETRRAGKHAGVSCEACHGPHAGHAADPAATAARRPDPARLCAGCHSANVAKPRGFPAVVAEEHAGTESCLTCHTAHDPGAAPEAER